MKILVQDQSVPMVADPEIWINGGKIQYKLNFKCPHDKVQMMFGEVLCVSCRSILSDKELRVEIA